jgi:hypothetical protein
MSPNHKPLVWLRGEVKSPPFSNAARLEAGYLLRQLQAGLLLPLPHSRPMPSIGMRCHELRIVDEGKTWRHLWRMMMNATKKKQLTDAGWKVGSADEFV